MASMATATRPYLILQPEDHVVLGEADFGMPGLEAIESIGPFVGIQASGPLVTVHDSTVEAGLGIGHHPHRLNERLFYIEAGQLDHDDALNGITGHMGPGDVGQFTEGRRGMVHSEWNHGDVDTKAYILVYSTDPVPDRASFNVLKDEDAPRHEDGSGVRTKELVGPRSSLRVNGDVRLFTDSEIEEGLRLQFELGAGEGGVASVRRGAVRIDDSRLTPGATLVVPPADDARSLSLQAEAGSQVIRVVHGPGYGFVREAPMPRRGSR
jgi:redox-sensitive bicupin YhaK (pirin superfamily)